MSSNNQQYNPGEVEAAAQSYWRKNNSFQVTEDTSK